MNGLKKRGYHNIYILDNDSTYEPLLDFYRTIDYDVIYLKKNIGHLALQNYPLLYRKIRLDYFVYTDSDLEIIDECPDDFIKHFLKILNNNQIRNKVGFSLKIDDLPNCYSFKEQVINWERQFYKQKTKEGYSAKIDTTFALHKPFTLIGEINSIDCIRTDFPYLMKHLPWYEDSINSSAEELFYKSTANSSASWYADDLGLYNIE
ncbi:MAG: glycosyltransferase family 2 protein [Pedobacter sp.]|nr:MAG: glycosyltransferase family 2 protein [Pedobacter sp.]